MGLVEGVFMGRTYCLPPNHQSQSTGRKTIRIVSDDIISGTLMLVMATDNVTFSFHWTTPLQQRNGQTFY